MATKLLTPISLFKLYHAIDPANMEFTYRNGGTMWDATAAGSTLQVIIAINQ